MRHTASIQKHFSKKSCARALWNDLCGRNGGVQIDKTHRGWAIGSFIFFAASAVVYAVYAANSPQGTRGGSAIGLTFGIFGFGFILFAALLGARKRVPTWRLGRAQSWMRGHLWLGLLSLPLILFHGGFHFGGTLTRILMWLLIVVVASGVYGAAMQHYLPRIMTNDAPLETIYDEIGNVRNLLREEADRATQALCGSLGLNTSSAEETQRAGGFTAMRPMSAAGGSAAVAAATEIVLLSDEESATLRRFYLQEMRPFLEHPRERGQRLAKEDTSRSIFKHLRTLVPVAAHGALDDLQDICEEARQLVRQERLHRWLHGWLLVHIPLSLALILLGAIHAVMALRY
jgi:hypothetical protein